MSYRVNEIFLSLQGEGGRVGEASVFVRFSGCNLRCDVEPGDRSPGGFACDTEFESGVTFTRDELLHEIEAEAGVCRWIVFTGGEPALQLDRALAVPLIERGFQLAIETNGTIDLEQREVAGLIDWITVSPKVAEHAIKQRFATEVKYVRGAGQGIPRTVVEASLKFLSPAFAGEVIDPGALRTCIQLVKENPSWRLSVQQHKAWRVR